ncbi:MAG: hypothetical protein Q8865_07170 [Bacillota bacterium]|nr:hypothetical protein [Bacillota bacterium]
MKYIVNYHTGFGDFNVEGSINQAKQRADDEATFTQQPISIDDEFGTEVIHRHWNQKLYGIQLSENPLKFGEKGYYDDWKD